MYPITCVFLMWILRNYSNQMFYKRSALQIRAGQQSITVNLWPLTAHIYYIMIVVTGGFSKKSFLIIIFRSSRTKMFFETGVTRNFVIFTGKHLCWNLFLIKNNFTSTLSQKRLQHRWFLWKLLKSLPTSFYGTPPVAAFVSLIKNCSMMGICRSSLNRKQNTWDGLH